MEDIKKAGAALASLTPAFVSNHSAPSMPRAVCARELSPFPAPRVNSPRLARDWLKELSTGAVVSVNNRSNHWRLSCANFCERGIPGCLRLSEKMQAGMPALPAWSTACKPSHPQSSIARRACSLR